MKNAIYSALWLAFGLAVAFALMPLIEDGIRLAFEWTLTAARWIQANPAEFTVAALILVSAWVGYLNHQNNPKTKEL